MTERITIKLPWPPTECRPNFIRSNHWSKWRPKGTAYKKACWALALEQGVNRIKWLDGPISLTYTFYPPRGCRWDDDAKEAAFKTGQDGIALAMGVDDGRFRVAKKHGGIVEDGCVVVQIIPPVVEIEHRGVIE
ncbi:hypothetical protein [uncultured Ruegeria sp.]|uniref:hypothetical protein n=1 Tax=uncultured Ruegeria sp. TaxID=259304 RepID=UPI00260BFA26|nr:hypothetical protein [uncultured Ruegeria sp.]